MQAQPRNARVLFATALAVVTVVTAGVAMQPVAAGSAIHNDQAVLQDDPQVTLESTTTTQQRGDIVVLNLTFSGGATVAEVTLGSDDVGFEVQFFVWDRDGDGSVSVLWNTAQSAGPDAGLSVAPDAGGQPDLFLRGPRVLNDISDPVEPAAYPVSVVTTDTGNETDLGTVFVEERASENLTVHTAPASEGSFESAAAVESAASSASAGETIAVADDTHDWVVLRLAASGLSGFVDEAADLDDADDGVTLTVTEHEASLGMNEEPVEVQLDGNATLYEAGDDVYFVVLSASALLDAGAEVGDQFAANVTVTEETDVTEASENLSTTFTLVEGRANFDLQDGRLAVAADEAAQVTGSSTWAPGTELLAHLYVAAGTGNSAFTAQTETAVGPDGNWSATLDLSAGTSGQQVTARLFHGESKARIAIADGELR